MNFTTSFEEFAKGVSSSDLMLYAGVGIVLWVLFKDKLSPVQQLLGSLINKVKGSLDNATSNTTQTPLSPKESEDIFFKLVVSWKQTRDLAEKSGCSKAVDVADQMFPFLSPTICSKKERYE